jgi:hypothetical protein
LNQTVWFWASFSLMAGTLALTATGHLDGAHAAEVITVEAAILREFRSGDLKDGQPKGD